jgi:hypothetical protein
LRNYLQQVCNCGHARSDHHSARPNSGECCDYVSRSLGCACSNFVLRTGP